MAAKKSAALECSDPVSPRLLSVTWPETYWVTLVFTHARAPIRAAAGARGVANVLSTTERWPAGLTRGCGRSHPSPDASRDSRRRLHHDAAGPTSAKNGP